MRPNAIACHAAFVGSNKFVVNVTTKGGKCECIATWGGRPTPHVVQG